MPSSKWRKYQNRIAQRAHTHGKNWRQTVVDCGAMCIVCYGLNSLEFHERFGDSKMGPGRLQPRVLLCVECHNAEHASVFQPNRFTEHSQLLQDVDYEIFMVGSYDNWIKKYELIDRFGWILNHKGDWNGQRNEIGLH